jgi:hypothetical protein
VFAPGTTTRKWRFSATIIGMATFFAHITTLPFFTGKKFEASLFVRKGRLKLERFKIYQKVFHDLLVFTSVFEYLRHEAQFSFENYFAKIVKK